MPPVVTVGPCGVQYTCPTGLGAGGDVLMDGGGLVAGSVYEGVPETDIEANLMSIAPALPAVSAARLVGLPPAPRSLPRRSQGGAV